ncbi:VWA domain-containing protein [Jejudonia soesokkakensis]|uniref:VWA domain-containing protein n=1 Tax=Jejudonia soesokkakensis TaxID=1323432 RepID=A0ABW2MT30_9FLAO
MTAETILYICIAAFVSLAVAIFMYGYKTRYTGNLRWVFGALRFITLFSILVLIINPKFKSNTYTVEKPKLPILLDNSSSIAELRGNDNVQSLAQALKENEDLNEKFDVNFFSFGSDFGALDSLSFTEKNTNIAYALSQTDKLFRSELAPTVLVTDGNQTLGSDYEFSSVANKNAIYPLIVGDSIQYTDLKIEQLNSNRYAFLKNKFPVEAIVVYNGTGSISSQFLIQQGANTVFRETVTLSETDNTKTISLTLPASSVGLQQYTAQILPIEDEKNTVNNSKRFAVEVIDQATNVLVVSNIIHPDLGALKKSITSNEQRTYTVKKPTEAVSVLNDYQLIVLFQPDRSFAAVFSEIDKLKKNTLTFGGASTDWSFLNSVQESFRKDVTNQTEDASATINSNYGTFAVEDIGFDDFPPLQTNFGALEITVPHETLLQQNIDGFDSGSPMLATSELNGKRDAIWDGEGIWKWRAQSYRDTKSFEKFDEFTGKLIQYLASNKRRSRLEVSSETFYYNNNQIRLSAQYFDQNFVFDPRASINITISNEETNERIVFPLLLKDNFYEVDLNSLNAGEYRYTVSVANENVSRSGSFTILDYNVEQQFGNANVTKLRRLATNSGGKSYFLSEYPELIRTLLSDTNYQSIQKSEQKIVPLIDWKYLLAIIVAALAAEWFIRKYNGLI